MRILVQNGLALPATWLTVASTIGLADVIAYKDSPGADTAILRGGLRVVAFQIYSSTKKMCKRSSDVIFRHNDLQKTLVQFLLQWFNLSVVCFGLGQACTTQKAQRAKLSP